MGMGNAVQGANFLVNKEAAASIRRAEDLLKGLLDEQKATNVLLRELIVTIEGGQ